MRLSDTQVGALADALERIPQSSTNISFMNYKFSRLPARKLGIMRARDYPRSGLITASSFGLAHESWMHVNFPDRIELVQTWDIDSLEYERTIVVVAETIVITQGPPKPGAIYLDAVKISGLAELAKRMPHAMVIFPYLWTDGFNRLDLDGTIVWFLQIVPIFDDERLFIEKQGFAKFEELLTYDGADFHKLNRNSHIGRF